MRRSATPLACLGLAAALPLAAAAAQPAAAVNEAIGSWRLACATDRMTDRTACQLLHQQPAERSEPGRPSLAFEIIDRGGRLVPAVTARELSLDNASRGLLAITGTVQLRFPPNRVMELPCSLDGRSLVCAPRGEDAARAEQELPQAGSVLLRVIATGGGGSTAEPVELPLSRTREAMDRFRRIVPPGPPVPEPSGIEPRELLQRFRQLFN